MIYILSEKLEEQISKCKLGQPRARECFEALLNIGITEQQIVDAFIPENSYNGSFEFQIGLLDLIAEEWNQRKDCEPHISIPDIKKKIKHSKNPMEKKILEKQLNGLYKERKRR